MGKQVAVVTKDKERQFEALRTGLGLLLEHHRVSLFVLDHEIDSDDLVEEISCHDHVIFWW